MGFNAYSSGPNRTMRFFYWLTFLSTLYLSSKMIKYTSLPSSITVLHLTVLVFKFDLIDLEDTATYREQSPWAFCHSVIVVIMIVVTLVVDKIWNQIKFHSNEWLMSHKNSVSDQTHQVQSRMLSDDWLLGRQWSGFYSLYSRYWTNNLTISWGRTLNHDLLGVPIIVWQAG